jgi:antitoxin MazE
METKVQKWGNSLGVRIPRSLAAGVRLRPGTSVEITGEEDAIVIRPVGRPRYVLSDLLKRISRRNLHGEVSAGAPVGKERL